MGLTTAQRWQPVPAKSTAVQRRISEPYRARATVGLAMRANVLGRLRAGAPAQCDDLLALFSDIQIP